MFDSYNNPIKSALELIVVEEKEDAKLYFTGVQRATPNEHIYDVTTLIQSSSTQSNCGEYSAKGYILEANGLIGKYYTNKWFSGEPYLVRTDANVNFNFQNGEIIPNVSKDYTSIEWSGLIKPLYSESYTFHTESNDGVRVYINDVLVLDSLVSSPSDTHTYILSSSAVTLTANQFASIKVMYFDETGNAFVSLFWESASQTKEVIPSTKCYHKLSESFVSNDIKLLQANFSPMKATALAQMDSSTYAANTISISWTAPTDDGCQTISSYKIQHDKSGSWADATTGLTVT